MCEPCSLGVLSRPYLDITPVLIAYIVSRLMIESSLGVRTVSMWHVQ